MRTASAFVVALGFAAAGCTSPEESQVSAGAGFASAEAAAEHVLSLYPPIQKNAVDGHVHEYY